MVEYIVPAFCEKEDAMRIPVWIVLLILGAMLAALSGCNGGNALPATTFGITGTVVTDGSPFAGAVVELQQNGQYVTKTDSAANGTFSFTNLPAGTYTLFVTGGSQIVYSLYGPIPLTSGKPEPNVQVTLPTVADLSLLVPPVLPPTNASITVVALANDANNHQLQQFTAKVGAMPPAFSIPSAPAFATIIDITSLPTTVLVTNTLTGSAVSFTQVNVPLNRVIWIQAIIP